MKLAFGNMTLELNAFNISKQSNDDGKIHEVNIIDTIIEQQVKYAEEENFKSMEFLEKVEDEALYEIGKWLLKFEELPAIDKSIVPSTIQPPTME